MALARRQAVPSAEAFRRTEPTFPVRNQPVFGQVARQIVQPLPREWRGEVDARLNELCSLPHGWNGYGADPVSFTHAYFAMTMLESICASNIPVPFIAPGPNGDLQVEWHVDGGDIELHVRAPNNVSAWRRTDATGEDGEELDLTTDFLSVAGWIKEMLEPAVAPLATAA